MSNSGLRVTVRSHGDVKIAMGDLQMPHGDVLVAVSTILLFVATLALVYATFSMGRRHPVQNTVRGFCPSAAALTSAL
jgi:hypothetical protein